MTVIDENTKVVIPCSELGDTADMDGLWSILMRNLRDPGYYDPSYDPDRLDRMEQVNYVFVDNKNAAVYDAKTLRASLERVRKERVSTPIRCCMKAAKCWAMWCIHH